MTRLSPTSWPAAIMLLACAASATALGPSWYKCDPGSCAGSKGCMCPNGSPPGGLSPRSVPQFIVLTHDDAVNTEADQMMRSLTDSHKNRNNCNIPATWFVLKAGTNCTVAKKLAEDGHELASHTVTHEKMELPLANTFKDEFVGVRDFLEGECGVAKGSVVGFRAPYLIHNALQRKVLHENGFLYDSSIAEYFGQSPVSPDRSSRSWPYTMDYSIPQMCEWMSGNEACTPQERHPGLWEFPVYGLQSEDGRPLFSMDPEGDENSLLEMLKSNFNMNYNGGRAPFGLFVHTTTGWFTEAHQSAASKFLAWALQQPDVFVVTVREVLRWMSSPVPASSYTPPCGKQNPTPGPAPKLTPGVSPGTHNGPACQWPGHCRGDPCASANDCDGEMICTSGVCGSGSLTPTPSPKGPVVHDPQPSACQWVGHCRGDPCTTFDDCDGDLTCSSGVCSGGEALASPVPQKAKPSVDGTGCQWKGHCLGDPCKTDDDCDGEWTCVDKACDVSAV